MVRCRRDVRDVEGPWEADLRPPPPAPEPIEPTSLGAGMPLPAGLDAEDPIGLSIQLAPKFDVT